MCNEKKVLKAHMAIFFAFDNFLSNTPFHGNASGIKNQVHSFWANFGYSFWVPFSMWRSRSTCTTMKVAKRRFATQSPHVSFWLPLRLPFLAMKVALESFLHYRRSQSFFFSCGCSSNTSASNSPSVLLKIRFQTQGKKLIIVLCVMDTKLYL